MKLIRGASVYAPAPLGVMDVLIGGDRIAALGEDLSAVGELPDVEVIVADDAVLVPGFIDMHVHITGGGGEAGMRSRTPELRPSTMIDHGVTCVAGLLGTDTVTRSLPNLLGKARALQEEGLSAVIYSGGYDYPPPTFGKSPREDLFLIKEVRGIKLSMADHRSSFPKEDELERLLADVRVGGMLRGFVAQLHLHIGDEGEGLDDLIAIARKRPHLAAHITATHVNRSRRVFEQGLTLAAAGANIDLSSGLTPETLHPDTLTIPEAVRAWLAASLPLERLTVSSDGNGSAAVYAADGSIAGFTAADMGTLFRAFQALVREGILSMPEALALVTRQPADRLHLPEKGRIAVGGDADLLLLDADLNLSHVYARGACLMEKGTRLVRDAFA